MLHHLMPMANKRQKQNDLDNEKQSDGQSCTSSNQRAEVCERREPRTLPLTAVSGGVGGTYLLIEVAD